MSYPWFPVGHDEEALDEQDVVSEVEVEEATVVSGGGSTAVGFEDVEVEGGVVTTGSATLAKTRSMM